MGRKFKARREEELAIDYLCAKRIWSLERTESKQWKVTEVSSPRDNKGRSPNSHDK